MPDPDPIPVLTALIGLTQVQLAEAWAELRDQNTYVLALAALGVAAIGIVVAAQPALGVRWWVPIPGLAVASVIALIATRGGSVGIGPKADSFYDAFGESEAPVALAQLLADLVDAYRQLAGPLRAQRVRILRVGAAFAVTAVYSLALLVMV